jgi:hypothetical protein
LYRITQPALIGIGRVPYDGMEIERHLPSEYGPANMAMNERMTASA